MSQTADRELFVELYFRRNCNKHYTQANEGGA